MIGMVEGQQQRASRARPRHSRRVACRCARGRSPRGTGPRRWPRWRVRRSTVAPFDDGERRPVLAGDPDPPVPVLGELHQTHRHPHILLSGAAGAPLARRQYCAAAAASGQVPRRWAGALQPALDRTRNARLAGSLLQHTGPAMPRFAANLSMMFNEWRFLDRFQAAAEDGFRRRRVPVPLRLHGRGHRPAACDNGLEQALSTCRPATGPAGERGFAAVPGREAEFRASVERALPYVEATGVRRVHVMSRPPRPRGRRGPRDLCGQSPLRRRAHAAAGRRPCCWSPSTGATCPATS